MDVQFGSHTLRSHGVVVARKHMHDWLIFLFLVVMDIILNAINPFYRFVGKDMMTDLKYPFKNNTVPVWAVPVGSLWAVPLLIVKGSSFMSLLFDNNGLFSFFCVSLAVCSSGARYNISYCLLP